MNRGKAAINREKQIKKRKRAWKLELNDTHYLQGQDLNENLCMISGFLLPQEWRFYDRL